MSEVTRGRVPQEEAVYMCIICVAAGLAIGVAFYDIWSRSYALALAWLLIPAAVAFMMKGWLSGVFEGPETVEYAELEEYVDSRYAELQDEIMDADMGEYEEQLNIVSWKGQQEELVNLLRHFEEGDNNGK